MGYLNPTVRDVSSPSSLPDCNWTFYSKSHLVLGSVSGPDKARVLTDCLSLVLRVGSANYCGKIPRRLRMQSPDQAPRRNVEAEIKYAPLEEAEGPHASSCDRQTSSARQKLSEDE